jgi:alcohol dehydrogenase class IV
MINYSLKTNLYIGDLEDFSDAINCDSFEKILILTSKTVGGIKIVSSFVKKIPTQKKVSVECISPEAPVQKLDEVVLRNEKPDLIIAIGGGSVLDSAKALSIGWQNGHICDYLYNNIPIPNTKIKLIAVPTTAGTGSEMSFGAILTDRENNYKGGIRSPLILPDSVVIDKKLYQFASKKLKSEAGFDCLAHAIETYVSTQSSTLIKMQSVNCILQIFSSLERAISGDNSSMELIAISSAMMGVNLAYSSTCLPHRMQYILGPYTNTRHSEGIICLYRGWLSQIRSRAEFVELSNTLGFSSDQFVNRINLLKNNLNINYSLKDFGVNEKMIEDMTVKVSGNLSYDPCFENIGTIRNIFKNSL